MADTNESAAPAADQAATPKTAARSPGKKATATRSASKKTSKKPAQKTTKKTATKTAANKSAAKKSAAKKTTARKSAAKKTTAKRTATSQAAVARAASATQKPVAAGRSLVEKAGERVADLSRAVLTPSSRFFARAPVRAQAIVADPAALRGLADKVLQSESGRSGPVGEVVDDFKTLGRLVAAYARGDYRDIPLDSLIVVIAGLVYVVSPIDLIPDAVPVAGYADDAVAVGFVIRQVHHELAAFREWEEGRVSSKA